MEPSSKLKALKFMQKRLSSTTDEAAMTLEQNRAKIAANVRWTLESKDTAVAPSSSFKVVYEQSGGANRASHKIFNNYKRKDTASFEEERNAGKSESSEPADGRFVGADTGPASSSKAVKLIDEASPVRQTNDPFSSIRKKS